MIIKNNAYMKIKRTLTALVLLLSMGTLLYAEMPEWTKKLPVTEDAFWGVGKGKTEEEAKELARKVILLQLGSHVKAALSISESSGQTESEIIEKLEMYLAENSLRGAELEESYFEDGTYWVLMKYCDDCGKLLLSTALDRYEEESNYETEKVIEAITKMPEVKKAVKIERRLEELNLEDYKSESIEMRLKEKELTIMVMNFLPYKTELSEKQNKELIKLSKSLLKELEEIGYKSIKISGHANPEGVANEEGELEDLSKNRAKTLEKYLSNEGIKIDGVEWHGGEQTIGNVNTKEGRGKKQACRNNSWF